ncbi:hypothetical protein DFH27DRAFT_527027 [Peziza echinospora]|nr:hypothetical protein DFH27DRAFT_527027 [Peziza echinospora]
MATPAGSYCGFQIPSRTTSPRPMPRFSSAGEIQRPYSPYQPMAEPIVLARGGLSAYGLRAFTPLSSPPSSRSPSVASWRSFEADYDDGLVIEEIESDDEDPENSDIEILIGEYEDAPSDDDEYWELRKLRRGFEEDHNSIICGFEELSTSKNSPPSDDISANLKWSPLVSPANSVRSSSSVKRRFSDSEAGDDTDTDSLSRFPSRRTRRRVIAHPRGTINLNSNAAKKSLPTTNVIRGFHVSSPQEATSMEE